MKNNFLNKIPVSNIVRIFPSLLIYLMIFFYLSNPTIDPDFGWHLVYGEKLLNHRQFLFNDIFSWTMPGYTWFNISWTYDVLVYWIFSHYGFTPLSVFEGLIFCLIYYMSIKPYKLPFLGKMIIAYLFTFFMSNLAGPGLRVQIFEILNITIFNFIIFKIDKYKNYNLSLLFPILMLFWVNIHGSFIVGLYLIGIFITAKFVNLFLYKKKIESHSPGLLLKQTLVYVTSLILSFGAVFINPSGYKIILQILEYLPQKRVSGINEWFPISFSTDIWLLMFLWTVAVLIIIVKKRRSTYGLYHAISILVFAYFAYKSRRMISPYFIVSLPVFLQVIEKKSARWKSNILNIIVFAFLISSVITGIYRLYQNNFFNFTLVDYCRFGPKCSVDASKFLKKNPLPDHSLTSYNFGGFTLWQNPESRVFIDGRMDQWQKNGYRVFADHQEILSNTNIALFNQYNFNAVYIQAENQLAGILKKQQKTGGYKVVFEDANAIIFMRNK